MNKKDVNYPPGNFADVCFQTITGLKLDLSEEERKQYDDTMKLSHVWDMKFYGLSVTGGRENAIDMNRECRNVLIEDAILFGGGHCPIVIKGGCENIYLKSFDIFHDGPYDVELGGWSDQSRKKTTGVTLENSYRLGPKGEQLPVRIVVGHADKPTIIGGNVRVPLAVRRWARSVAKHFPSDYDVDKVKKKKVLG
jgi:hypothetical protein